MYKIKILDLVSGTDNAVINGHKLESLYKVIGAKRIGELSEYGGIWILKDIVSGKEYECLGQSLIVWKPAPPDDDNPEAKKTYKNNDFKKCAEKIMLEISEQFNLQLFSKGKETSDKLRDVIIKTISEHFS